MPELLSPAGNREKLEAAILYGADAVYLSGESFGMRAFADNFSLLELKDAVSYAHTKGVKVYLTVNTMPREDEYARLREYFIALRDVMPDALIIADIGVLFLAKELLPGVEIHLSTQANATSAAACRAWHSLGAKRIVTLFSPLRRQLISGLTPRRALRSQRLPRLGIGQRHRLCLAHKMYVVDIDLAVARTNGVEMQSRYVARIHLPPVAQFR